MASRNNKFGDFYGETEISIELKRQKYSNILAILNIKFNESKDAMLNIKKVYKHLSKKKSYSSRNDIAEIKELLKELKSDGIKTTKLESKNDILKTELEEINKEYKSIDLQIHTLMYRKACRVKQIKLKTRNKPNISNISKTIKQQKTFTNSLNAFKA